MAGAFGLAGGYGRYRPPGLQEVFPCLRVFAVYQQGALVQGWAGTVNTGPGGGLPSIRTPGFLEVDGAPIPVRPHPCLPAPVFGCPLCDADRYKVYYKAGLWGCPKCHGLDRASRHRNRNVRGYWRELRIRRRIAPGSALFDPLPVMRINAPKFWRDAIELRRIEAGLAGIVESNATVLEKRHGRRQR